ncbi:GPW/gp25 family protein [Lysobacter dokdonensis DS-58]|uniref:GPW/gp25 family protein n=1 Tax=Lysobacter dokdonensis DS-58 TaxID=1300345 RepID=A0A0A2WHT1_9GAMM|nr:GPW/gp25 family protein [Lysobacter dokdonensis]KGQ19373.1 GPW/gp25 family protein [Lysobacter dokdonensis DS-58]
MADELREPGFLGRGWAFPVVAGAAGQVALVAGATAIEQAIGIILGTSPGERVMRPEFGCGIWGLVMETNTAQLHGRVQLRVRDALVRWEPRIDVLDVRVESPPEERQVLLIHIDYRVRSNNAAYNLVYPFFLEEGVRQ